jgi:hypothetical protein
MLLLSVSAPGPVHLIVCNAPLTFVASSKDLLNYVIILLRAPKTPSLSAAHELVEWRLTKVFLERA